MLLHASAAINTPPWVGAGLAELRQQKHRAQMGHVAALGVDLRCPFHGILQDAQKLRCDLFPVGHGRFDRRSLKLSGIPFELV
jgi:hypothetical protein